jgi:signal transduction histidine kinase
MIVISRFFKNHLSNRQISAEELRQFTEDHLGKLAALASPPAAIADLVAPTRAAFDDFDAKLSARTVLQTAQVGGTVSKGEALKLIRSTLRRREARIRDKFIKGSAAYTEFFPQGLVEIAQARHGQINGILDRFLVAADKHKAAVGPELLAEFTALKARYTRARDGQVESKGDLAHARAALAAARSVLELQLGRNILAIASHHLGHPERAVDYFTQSLLEDPTRQNEDPAPAEPQG